MKIGMVTIGQTPRDDVVPEIEKVIDNPNTIIIQEGALDGLTEDELNDLKPTEDEDIDVLVTRLRDGREIKLKKEKVIPKFEEKIHEIDKKADIITYLCAGEFPKFTTKKPILYPFGLVTGFLKSFEIDTLGLMIPSPHQLSDIPPKYEKLGFNVKATAYSPYGSSSLQEKAKELINCDLIFMDCFGYTIEMKNKVKMATDTPTVLTRTILARALAEII